MSIAVDHSKPRLEPLTSLRFPAAALAVLGHTSYYFRFAVPFLGAFTLNQGVSFFFILSGFILTYVYAPLEWRNVPRYLVARIARIWPMLFVAWLIPFVFIPAKVFPSSTHTLKAVVTELTFVRTWFVDPPLSVNGVSWSLSVEFFFYLSLPILLWCWQRKPAAVLTTVVVLGIALIIVDDLATGRNDHSRFYGFVAWNPVIRLMEFTAGVATAYLWRWLHPRLTLRRKQGTALEIGVVALVAAVMYGCTGWSEWITRTHWNVLTVSWIDRDGYMSWFGHGMSWWLRSSGFLLLPFAALILVMAFQAGHVSRVLSWRPLLLLGEISYAVYLLHETIFVFWVLHPALTNHVPSVLRYIVYWLIVLVASFLGWALVETPCRRGIVHRWDHLTRARRAAIEAGQEIANPPLPVEQSARS